ncbi:hypothetical protein GCM10010392_64100 [Streptomyces clavifer]|nr:hypothetical protein GCM10010392_64100 [Streptomyces clavifer]
MGGVGRPQRSGVVFELGDVQERWGQYVPEGFPPPGSAFPREVEQALDVGTVRAVVIPRHDLEARGTDAEAARLDVAELGLADADQACALGGGEPCSLTQAPELGTEASATDVRSRSGSHTSTLPAGHAQGAVTHKSAYIK